MKYLVIGNQVTPVMEQKAQAGFFIINADSHENLMQELTDCPIGPISEFEVQPICDFDKATDITLKKLKNLGLI